MIYCPHCSRSIESHDGKPCPRQFSRRFFFGLLAGAGAAVVVRPNPDMVKLFRRDYLRAACQEMLYGGSHQGGKSYAQRAFVTSINYETKTVTLGSNPPPGYTSDVRVGDILKVSDWTVLRRGREFEVPVPESWKGLGRG